jgi:hypothetical protein
VASAQHRDSTVCPNADKMNLVGGKTWVEQIWDGG